MMDEGTVVGRWNENSRGPCITWQWEYCCVVGADKKCSWGEGQFDHKWELGYENLISWGFFSVSVSPLSSWEGFCLALFWSCGWIQGVAHLSHEVAGGGEIYKSSVAALEWGSSGGNWGIWTPLPLQFKHNLHMLTVYFYLLYISGC